MQGSCLCGGVRYAIEALSTAPQICHCQTCRKAHAAPAVVTAGVARSAFRWLQGEALLNRYESSPGKWRHFCSVCGCQLIAEREGQAHLILRLATLDEDPGVMPEAHIWTSHDQPWLSGEGLPRYPQWPPGR
ncbi:GFA family protein [Halomonas salifodinae]|uniref:GFA family protein n=1 Tax=Halomonas salifodinae TaxID=438745 RepID=A0ABW2ET57_9GAMM